LLEENHIQDHPSSRRSIHGGSMKRNRAYHWVLDCSIGQRCDLSGITMNSAFLTIIHESEKALHVIQRVDLVFYGGSGAYRFFIIWMLLSMVLDTV
jgi:hypothetical protein